MNKILNCKGLPFYLGEIMFSLIITGHININFCSCFKSFFVVVVSVYFSWAFVDYTKCEPSGRGILCVLKPVLTYYCSARINICYIYCCRNWLFPCTFNHHKISDSLFAIVDCNSAGSAINSFTSLVALQGWTLPTTNVLVHE